MKKFALVTGSTKGIGLTIGMKLLERGCFVIFNYGKDDAAADRLNGQLSLSYKGQFEIVKADLSSVEGLEVFVDKMISGETMLDYVVLNVALTDKTPFDEITVENWQKVITANLTVPFFACQKLRKNINDNGSVLFIGTILGVYPHAISHAYGISKAGLHAMTRYLVKEFCERNITVNCILPGFVETPWHNDKPNDQRARIESKIALGRFAAPEEIADMSFSILKNGYINGALVTMDGGYCFR